MLVKLIPISNTELRQHYISGRLKLMPSIVQLPCCSPLFEIQCNPKFTSFVGYTSQSYKV